VYPLLCKVKQFILLAANVTEEGSEIICLNDINEFLVDDIDVERLQRELIMLSDYFSAINKQKNLDLKKITKIATVSELLNTQQVAKAVL
jgi:uncharacterized membrane protein (DUF106 family)